MQNLKIALFTVAMACMTPQLSLAISGSGISDAITNAKPSSIGNKPVTFVQDSAITAYIHAQLIITKGVPASIDVSTIKGVVKLEGKVESKEQANAVTKLASSVSGVKSVDASKLKITQ